MASSAQCLWFSYLGVSWCPILIFLCPVFSQVFLIFHLLCKLRILYLSFSSLLFTIFHLLFQFSRLRFRRCILVVFFFIFAINPIAQPFLVHPKFFRCLVTCIRRKMLKLIIQLFQVMKLASADGLWLSNLDTFNMRFDRARFRQKGAFKDSIVPGE